MAVFSDLLQKKYITFEKGYWTSFVVKTRPPDFIIHVSKQGFLPYVIEPSAMTMVGLLTVFYCFLSNLNRKSALVKTDRELHCVVNVSEVRS